MEHIAQELQSDLLIFSEIPRGPPDSQGWVSSSDEKSAVALTQTATMAATDSSKGPGFAFMQFPGLLVLSCYWKPGGPIQEFEGYLFGVDAVLMTRLTDDCAVVIAGDFNAKATAWGSAVNDARGEALKRFAANLWPENVGLCPDLCDGRPYVGD